VADVCPHETWAFGIRVANEQPECFSSSSSQGDDSMTTYVEQGDSGNVMGMVLLILAVLAVVGFGIWYFSGYNAGTNTIIERNTNTIVPAPSPINVTPAPSPSPPAAPSPQPSGTGTGGM
jgi:hypothetical protein